MELLSSLLGTVIPVLELFAWVLFVAGAFIIGEKLVARLSRKQ